MRQIPAEIYERIFALTCELTDATLADDTALAASVYQQLFSYYEETSRAGNPDPFVTETLADFTADAAKAIAYYELALEQSKFYPDEPRHTKMISLAERLIETGRREQAEAYLRDGRAEAVRCGDKDWIEKADMLIKTL